MEPTIIVIPAEGDSPETTIWYIKALKLHCKAKHKKVPQILVFEHDCSAAAVKMGVALSTQLQVRKFIAKNDFTTAEIHAQGGLGAYVAYEFLRYCDIQDAIDHYGRKITLSRVFMIGGAPSSAMTWMAKWFHCCFVHLWYHMQWLVPFFADDPPNSQCAEEIEKIRNLSTQFMRANPELYRDQLLFIGDWRIPDDWRVAHDQKVWYVPNGETLRSKWRDNTYNDTKAKAEWAKHGVNSTARPEDNFSFYSMMPAEALFYVMHWAY